MSIKSMSCYRHPEHWAFYRSIIAAPADDLPRLVYADALDERGDPFGHCIRLMIAEAEHSLDKWLKREHARAYVRHSDEVERFLSERPADDRYANRRTMMLDAATSLVAHEGAARLWYDNDPAAVLTLHRGFPSLITLSWQEWLRHHAALTRSIPLTHVVLRQGGPASDHTSNLARWQTVNFFRW